jgi:hypothetical protein
MFKHEIVSEEGKIVKGYFASIKVFILSTYFIAIWQNKQILK